MRTGLPKETGSAMTSSAPIHTPTPVDPCKLTMEDLFPSRPEPPTSEDTKQPEDESEDWLIEWDRENMDRKTIDVSKKIISSHAV